MQLKRNQMFCVMLRKDAQTALTETCHGKGLCTSIFLLINSIVCATCIWPLSTQSRSCFSFRLYCHIAYTYLTVKKCSSAYFSDVKVVPQKEAKHQRFQEVFVCPTRAHRRITSSGLAGRRKTSWPQIRRLEEVKGSELCIQWGKHNTRG